MSHSANGFVHEITMKSKDSILEFKNCGAFDVRIERSDPRPIFGMIPEICVEFRFVARAFDIQPIVDEIAKLPSLRNLQIDTSSGVTFPYQIGGLSGSATPVDPPQFQCQQVTPMPAGEITFDGHFDPDPPASANPSCPECSGRGEIQLFTSVVPCKCCGGGN